MIFDFIECNVILAINTRYRDAVSDFVHILHIITGSNSDYALNKVDKTYFLY